MLACTQRILRGRPAVSPPASFLRAYEGLTEKSITANDENGLLDCTHDAAGFSDMLTVESRGPAPKTGQQMDVGSRQLGRSPLNRHRR